MRRLFATLIGASLAVALAVACSGNDRSSGGTVKLVVYDSFPAEKTSLNDALAEFTTTTGIKVELVISGDTGTMLAKAKLTAGNPEGDVMFGIDNTFLSAALDANVFEPYTSAQRTSLDPALTVEPAEGVVTPVDYGDVCINFDIAAFTKLGIAPPASLDDLAKPEYTKMLVVENPATSSPGMAFLLATIAKYGATGWQDYWTKLRANGVEVVDSWDAAYYERFSGSGGSTGDRPLVVSYGSSPPAEVLFAKTPITTAPTGVIADSCFRQVEYVGVLRGTSQTGKARRLVDFLVSERFQRELPLTLFVYPSRTGVALPDEFTKYAVIPAAPLAVNPADIATNRQAWQDEWTKIVVL